MGQLTISDIAALACVSRSTVSRVLNSHAGVRQDVRERVLRVISQHNYEPQIAARNLAGSRTSAIGLVLAGHSGEPYIDPFLAQLVPAIVAACAAHGYVLLLTLLGSHTGHQHAGRLLRARHFDGVILLGTDIDDPLLPQLLRERFPLVLIGRHPYLPSVAWVDAANREGARLAVAHLIGLGHRRIAIVTGPEHTVVGADRRDGYKQALLEAGLAIASELIVYADFGGAGGRRAIERLLDLPDRPTAVFVAGDTMALGALQGAQAAGLRVPRDLALVGFDDLPFASYITPALTTIRQPIAELGAAAVRLLLQQCGRRPGGAQIQLPVELIVRESCGATRQYTSAEASQEV